MEIVICLLIFAALAYYLVGQYNKTTELSQEEEAPYKVEAPVLPVAEYEPKKCGCGRSSTGYCSGLHALSPDEWAKSDANPHAAPMPVAQPKKVAKPKVAKSTPAKKPAALKVVTGNKGKAPTKPKPKAKPAK